MTEICYLARTVLEADRTGLKKWQRGKERVTSLRVTLSDILPTPPEAGGNSPEKSETRTDQMKKKKSQAMYQNHRDKKKKAGERVRRVTVSYVTSPKMKTKC